MQALNEILARSSIEYRINYLLNTITAYLRKVSYPTSELYKTISAIRYNMGHLNNLSESEANTYKYKVLNYLEGLHHSFLWRYGNIAS